MPLNTPKKDGLNSKNSTPSTRVKFLLTHLGLGDAIIMAGAAVALSNRHAGLVFPCYERNMKSLVSFFRFHPDIMVLPVEDEEDMLHLAKLHQDGGVIAVGHYSNAAALPEESFDEWMYRTAGVPFPARWAACPLKLAAMEVKQIRTDLVDKGIHSFLHDDPLRGFEIAKATDREFRYVHPAFYENQESILAFANILAKVPEIHVINSAFLHLSESLETNGELFFYPKARAHKESGKFDIPQLRKPWKFME